MASGVGGLAALAGRRKSSPLPSDVAVDVEVEAHADPLEEVVVERDEADLDGHLEVLQPPQLLQQIGDFLVHVLRLADDDAQVRLEGGDRARSADVVPRGGLDGRVDQVDQAVEVGLRAAAESARPGARRRDSSDRRSARRAGRWTTWASMFGLSMALLPLPSRLATTASGVAVDEPNGMPPPPYHGFTLRHGAVVGALQAHRRGHEVRNRHDQVGHVVGHACTPARRASARW